MKKYGDYMNPGYYGWTSVVWVKVGGVVIKLDEVTHAKQSGSDVEVFFQGGSSIRLEKTTIGEFWNIVCEK